MPGSKDRVNGADFNRRVQIQAPTPADDGEGGSTTVWNTIFTCWANIENFPHGRGLWRKFLFQQLYPQMNTTIQIRFQRSVNIDPTMRVFYPAHGINHIYQILGIENPMEANVSMWLLCQENQTQAVN